MEEIVTVDGRQFKLSVDRPLNATERAQVLAEIRKQTGCSTCGPRTAQPRTLSTGGVYSLPMDTDYTGTGTSGKSSGSTVTLTATPAGGVGPYKVRFWRSNIGDTPIQTDIVNPDYLSAVENTPVAATYTITDIDVAAAVGNAAATLPLSVNDSTGALTLGGAVATLATGSIRFYTSIVDSCPSAVKGTCAQYADVVLTCVAPTCSFVVT